MKRQLIIPLIVVALLVPGSGTASETRGSSSKEKEVAKHLPTFPYEQGWLGADDAYSIPLTSTKSVWLFGDTFVGDPGTTLRSKYKAMPRNSVGISECDANKNCTITYYWSSASSPKPRSFFDTGRDDVWYWPMDGYYDGKALYLSLMIVRNKKGAGPEDPFGFEIAGTQWMVIDNPLDSPDRWHMNSKPLTNGGLWVGNSTFIFGNYVYLYTQVSAGEGKGYVTVLRAPADKLADPSKQWEYLGTGNQWHAGTPHGDAAQVVNQAIAEMSVRYHPSIKKWVAISGGPEFPSNRIVARTADSPIGPWSTPVTIYHFPEMDPKNPIYDKDTFCYATKEHAEFGNTEMVVTYACNSMSIQKTIGNMNIYRPQVVVLPFPVSNKIRSKLPACIVSAHPASAPFQVRRRRGEKTSATDPGSPGTRAIS
jgi:hypothetical protein